MRKIRYDIYINTSMLGVVPVAECVLLERNHQLEAFGFRYRPEYLDHPAAFSLDPAQLPLTPHAFEFSCRDGTPGILDDYLPDGWGRKILAQLALYRDRQELNAHSPVDMLSMIGHSRIGAVCIVPQGHPPHFDLGASLEELSKAEYAAQQIDNLDFNRISPDEMSLLYLANTGTGIGGARPKALLHDQRSAYVAKFNRIQDPYNNARIELACLKMADKAGIYTALPGSHIRTGINGRETLLLKRFDINPDGTRNHLVSLNTVLKEPETQRDIGRTFRYDHIHSVLQIHSACIETDLQQLLLVMLFNRGINNTDDHERNFSLIHHGDNTGYHLAPAYDLVPSVLKGAYHAAGFKFNPNPPTVKEVTRMGKVFGLPQATVKQCAEQVQEALTHWYEIADETGVDEIEAQQLAELFQVKQPSYKRTRVQPADSPKRRTPKKSR